ncbi:MAG: methyl-accepting chemotaxis protein [Bdellovibrionales bacterium]
MMNMSSLSKGEALQKVSALLLFGALISVALQEPAWLSLTMLASALTVALGAMLFCRKASQSINKMENCIHRLEQGDYEARIVSINESGNLYKLATQINHFVDMIDGLTREISHSMGTVSQGKYYRKILETGFTGALRKSATAINGITQATEERIMLFHSHANMFEKSVKKVVESVAMVAHQVQGSAESMSGNALTTESQSNAAAAAATEMLANAQTVATAAEELSASISEIDRQVTQSTSISKNAVQCASGTDQEVQELVTATEKIGSIVAMIGEISEQTNLLALNATIEAARAGEAGKGFAVVAGEVKSLANQAARATEEITEQINAMRNVSERVAKALKDVVHTISESDAVATGISSSITEQRAATQEIARNVQEVANATHDVSRNVSTVVKAAGETKTTSGQVLDLAKSLSAEARQLQSEVDKFLVTVRKT